MNRYKIIGNISEGSHGFILKAYSLRSRVNKKKTQEADDDDDNFVAIKRIFLRRQEKSVPVAIIREIKCLQFLEHENIVNLLDVFAHGSSVNLVFPLLPTNLTTLIYEYKLTENQMIVYMYMLIDGLNYCHLNEIIHRDLKPSNLLIDWNGILKICDFGLARIQPKIINNPKLEDQENGGFMSHEVCTRWYRAPELLYGANKYDFSIDMWSVGCILGEMLQHKPLFKGESDIEQLFLVVSTLGSPPSWWSNVMPDFNKIIFNVSAGTDRSSKWFERLKKKHQNEQAIELIKKLCSYTDRLTAPECLKHAYFDKINEKKFLNRNLIKPRFIKQLIGPP